MVGRFGVDAFGSGYGQVEGSCEHGNVLFLYSIKC